MKEDEAIKQLISLKDHCSTMEDNIFKDDVKAIETILDLYQKEKEKNFKRSDMIFQLKSNNTYLKDRVTALENADLTTIYLSGFYDGEKKLKDKIKEKIEEWDVSIKWANADDRFYAIKILKELLEE